MHSRDRKVSSCRMRIRNISLSAKNNNDSEKLEQHTQVSNRPTARMQRVLCVTKSYNSELEQMSMDTGHAPAEHVVHDESPARHSTATDAHTHGDYGDRASVDIRRCDKARPSPHTDRVIGPARL